MMFDRKAIALPINMLVILAIAIIVLLAVVAFFMGVFTGQTGQMTRQQKITECCQKYVNQGCCGGDCTIPCVSNLDISPETACCMGAIGATGGYPETCVGLAKTIVEEAGGCSEVNCEETPNVCEKCCPEKL